MGKKLKPELVKGFLKVSDKILKKLGVLKKDRIEDIAAMEVANTMRTADVYKGDYLLIDLKVCDDFKDGEWVITKNGILFDLYEIDQRDEITYLVGIPGSRKAKTIIYSEDLALSVYAKVIEVLKASSERRRYEKNL